MEKSLRSGLRTWIEINTKAITHNYKVFRSLISKRTKLCGVVKSNAYGHYLTEFAKRLEKLGIDYLAVDSVVEGLTLRREGIKIPILVLGYTLPEMLVPASEAELEITISNFDYFNEIKKLKLKKPIRAHIKVDTGFHRHGFQIDDIKNILVKIKEGKNIKVVGLYTHFAAADNPAFPKETRDQIKILLDWKKAFSRAKIKVITHACATSGTILYPEAHFDFVRVGIGVYGLWPSAETKAFAEDKFILKPALSWRTLIGEIKNVKKGERVGYDFTETLNRDTKIAVLPIGYWHVFPRALSSIGHVLVRGKKVKVIGRVCMDITMIDVTDVAGVNVGDEVTIIGQDGKENISSADIAKLVDGSSEYETVTRINPLIKRIYI
ncbi:MAG: alanine racemase [Candidatus Paceibacterota bacterium]